MIAIKDPFPYLIRDPRSGENIDPWVFGQGLCRTRGGQRPHTPGLVRTWRQRIRAGQSRNVPLVFLSEYTRFETAARPGDEEFQ